MKPINAGIEPELFAYLSRSLQEDAPFYNMVGVYLEKLGPGYAELSLKAGQQHTNPLGLIHGGAIMTLADAAMGNAIRSTGVTGVTVDCSTAFIAGAKIGDRIWAHGETLKTGKKLLFAEAKVYSDDTLIAHAKGTFYNLGRISLDHYTNPH